MGFDKLVGGNKLLRQKGYLMQAAKMHVIFFMEGHRKEAGLSRSLCQDQAHLLAWDCDALNFKDICRCPVLEGAVTCRCAPCSKS